MSGPGPVPALPGPNSDAGLHVGHEHGSADHENEQGHADQDSEQHGLTGRWPARGGPQAVQGHEHQAEQHGRGDARR